MENNKQVETDNQTTVLKDGYLTPKIQKLSWCVTIFLDIVIVILCIMMMLHIPKFISYIPILCLFLITFSHAGIYIYFEKVYGKKYLVLTPHPTATVIAQQIAQHYNQKPLPVYESNISVKNKKYITIEQNILNELDMEEIKCLLVQKIVERKYENQTDLAYLIIFILFLSASAFFEFILHFSYIQPLLIISFIILTNLSKLRIEYMSIYESLKYTRSYSIVNQTNQKLSAAGFSPESLKTIDPFSRNSLAKLNKKKLGYLNKAAKKLGIPIPPGI